MPSGGPAAFGIGLISGFAGAQQRAHQQTRAQLTEAIHLMKDQAERDSKMRESQDAIAKEGQAYAKAQAEFDRAHSDYDLVQARISQIMASPGKPFRDAGLEGNLEKARDRMADAHSALQESQGNLQGLIEDRDARIRSAIPQRKEPATGLGGYFGIGSPESVLPPEQQFGGKGRSDEQVAADKAEIVKRETEHTPENRDSARSVSEAQRETRKYRDEESRERGNIGSAERALEVGRAEQGPQNEEARQAKIFPLDKELRDYREKQDAAKAGMAAAAQELQNQQARQQQLRQQQQQIESLPGYQRAMQGGAATGKGGATGSPLAGIMGKGGGMGAPAPQNQSAASSMSVTPPGAGMPSGTTGMSAGGGVTVAQALAPVAGKFLQMPAPQAVGLVRSVLGGGTPPAGFAGKGSFAQPAQGGGARSTQHFHFHQAPSGSQGAPTPPRRPDFPAQGGQYAEPAYQPTRRAMDEPAMEWYRSHPEVPAHVVEQAAQRRTMIPGGAETPYETPPWQQNPFNHMQGRASNMNQGVPTIHSPDQLKGMKPGSVFRAPDGSLKMVPGEVSP